jgi:hypothetical protein
LEKENILSPSSTVVQHPTYNRKSVGSNPTTRDGRQKMTRTKLGDELTLNKQIDIRLNNQMMTKAKGLINNSSKNEGN